jgi:hypothetical protein
MTVLPPTFESGPNGMNDVAAAKNTSVTGNCPEYRKWATNDPTHVAFGRNGDTIKVQPGDPVSIGQTIGWAGNTGCGAAPGGLDSDGTPSDDRVNVHLHTYLAIELPGETVPHNDGTQSKLAVLIDPYAVYGKADDGCYDGLKGTNFPRVYMPFWPDFHGVRYSTYNRNARYEVDGDREAAQAGGCP